MTDLAQAIVEYRARERISQREFARRAGLSLQTIYSIETGQQEPSRVTEAKIRLVIKEIENKKEA